MGAGPPPAAAPQKGGRRRNAAFELFFLDEAHFNLHPYLARCWRRRGEEVRVPAPGTNRRVSVAGAFDPQRGQLLSVVARRISGREIVKLLEKLAARARRTGRLVVAVLDNAQVHKTRLVRKAWQRLERFVRPLWLPTYSPDLNDIERVWKREKERYFANALSPSHEAFEARVRARFRSLAHVACRNFPHREGRRLRIPAILRNLGVVA